MKDKLKIIFFGSSEFSVEVLKALIEAGYPLPCVVTQPDKGAGRHLKLQPTAVKAFAANKTLTTLVAENLKEETFIDTLVNFHPDIFVVVSFGGILPREILNIPRVFPLNIHASLLPKYRGAAPIQWVIINGESVTGITTIRMNEKMDEGDIIAQDKIAIDISDNAITLEEKLAKLACRQILNVLKLIEEGKAAFLRQDNRQATYAPKLTKNSGRIDWGSEASAIYNQIRGCLPWPVAFTSFKGKRLRIFSAKIGPEFKEGAKPGEIICLKEKGIFIAAKNSSIKIEQLQPESAKHLTACEFISGARLKAGDSFGS